jgi:hypothetical protein
MSGRRLTYFGKQHSTGGVSLIAEVGGLLGVALVP